MQRQVVGREMRTKCLDEAAAAHGGEGPDGVTQVLEHAYPGWATPGYFARQRNRCGRQIGRVVASPANEIVTERLYPGNVQLARALPELVTAAATTIEESA